MEYLRPIPEVRIACYILCSSDQVSLFVVNTDAMSQDEDSDYSLEGCSPDDIISFQRHAPMLLSMPQLEKDPPLPPRPEFPPFMVPYLGDAADAAPYDGEDLETYPERHEWIVHRQDDQCDHQLCYPGVCYPADDWDALNDYYGQHGPISPMLSRTGSNARAVITGTSKAAFLQSWLFFGTLHAVSHMCNPENPINVQNECLKVEDGHRRVSTDALNGLAGRWFSSLSPEKVGNEDFMKQLIKIGRRMVLLLDREVSSRPDGEPVFQYTFDEALVFYSIDLLVRVISLHLLLHAYSPSLKHRRGKFYARLVRLTLVSTLSDDISGGISMREGYEMLSNISTVGERSHGWCRTELEEIPGDLGHFITVLNRPLARDHSACDGAVCGAYQVDEATYQTAHTDYCSRHECSPVEIKSEVLTKILDRNEIPVVVIRGDLSLEVVSGFEHPYTAISHVCECFFSLLCP